MYDEVRKMVLFQNDIKTDWKAEGFLQGGGVDDIAERQPKPRHSRLNLGELVRWLTS